MMSGTITRASSMYSRGIVLARVATAPEAILLSPAGVPTRECETKSTFSWSESSEKMRASPDLGRSWSWACMVAMSVP